MTEIIEFKRKPGPEDMVWQCQCGCSSFFVREDSKAECQVCGAVANDGAGDWRTLLPDPPATAPPVDKSAVKVTMLNVVAAFKQTVGMADVDESAFVIVVQKNGHVRAWGQDFATADQVDWVDDRLGDARRCLVKPGS